MVWIQIQTPTIASFVPENESSDLSELRFPYVENEGDNYSCFHGLPSELMR